MQDSKHSVAIVGAQAEEEAIIRSQIEEMVDILAVEKNPLNVRNMIIEKHPSIVLFYLDDNMEAVLNSTKEISLNGTFSIIVSKNKEPENILMAMRSGAKDYAFLDEESSDICRAITDLGTLQKQIESSGQGKVVAVFGSKGGSGATTIASNLAGSLLTHGNGKNQVDRRVALLDFDFEMGDVLVFLDMEQRFSFMEILSNKHRLDSELLYRSMAMHSSGLCVVSQTERLEEGGDLNAEEMMLVIKFLQQHFDFVVIDGLRDFRDISLVALDNADKIVLTMTQDIPALKNANRCLQIFQRLGYKEEKIKLVLNRYRNSRHISSDSISDALGRTVDATVANDFPAVIKSINEGELMVRHSPGSKVAKNISSLASMFVEIPTTKRSLFSLWGH